MSIASTWPALRRRAPIGGAALLLAIFGIGGLALLGPMSCWSVPRPTTIGVFSSADGGASWTFSEGDHDPLWADPTSESFLASRGGDIVRVASGRGSDSSYDTIRERRDLGSPDLRAVWQGAGGVLHAVGLRGAVFRLGRGDGRWLRRSAPTEADLHGVAGVSDDIVFAAAEDGVYRTADGWREGTATRVVESEHGLRAIWASAAVDLVVAVGDRGTIHRGRPSDGSWSPASSGTSTSLRAVTGDGVGGLWAVGDAGTIIRSTDRGRTWSPSASGTDADLRAIVTRGDGALWVAGAAGTLLHSTDRGETWSRVAVPANATGEAVDLRGVAALEGGLVCAIGAGRSIAIVNGRGERWRTEQLDDGSSRTGTDTPADELRAIVATADGGLLVIGDRGQICRSVRGGKVWTRQQSGVRQSLNAVWGAGRDAVFTVGGRGTILRTADRGETWTAQDSGVESQLHGVWGTSAERVWVVGFEGTILHTEDGGVTWVRQDAGTSAHLLDIRGRSADELWVVGVQGTLLRSDDGGATWESLAVDGIGGALREIALTPEGDLWAAGYGLAHSTDGRAWTKVDSEGLPSGTNAIAATSDGTLWLAEWLSRSTDGGRSFESTIPPTTGGTISDIFAVGADDVYAVGSSGLLHTNDGGRTWARQVEPLAGSLGHPQAVWARGPEAWVVSFGGAIYHAVEDTLGWRWDDIGYVEHIGAVWGSSASELVAVGLLGKIVRSADGGATWQDGDSPTSVDLSAVRGGSGRIYAVGEDGTVLLSSDGGRTWSVEPTPTDAHLLDVAVAPDGSAWAVGHEDTVLRKATPEGSWRALRHGAAKWVRIAIDATGTAWIGSGGSILRSDDDGATWSAPEGLPDGAWTDLAIGAEGAIVVVEDAGVIARSVDGGATWTSTDLGLERRWRVSRIAADATGGIHVSIDERHSGGGRSLLR